MRPYKHNWLDKFCFRHLNGILKFLNWLPVGKKIKGHICSWMHRMQLLDTMWYVCPICGRVAHIDCHDIPYPTCGSAKCDDAVLQESNEEYMRMRAEASKKNKTASF